MIRIAVACKKGFLWMDMKMIKICGGDFIDSDHLCSDRIRATL